MGVPLISEANKNKELLLEIDSVVTDTNGHHLADISLSSTDSLSRSRRRWKLIKIISKMNPSFHGKSKKLIFYQSLSALLSMILTGILIYWVIYLKSHSAELSPSPSSLVSSSRSSPLSPKSSLKSLSSSSSSGSIPSLTLSWSEDFDINPSETLDNPSSRSMETSNDTNKDDKQGVVKVTDTNVKVESGESKDDNEGDSRGGGNFFKNFPTQLPFLPFQSFPQDWFERPLGGPLFLPPFFPPPPPPSSPSAPFQVISSFKADDESPTPIPGPFFEQFTPSTFNLDQIKSSAEKIHQSAVGAFDEMVKKLTSSSSLADFLSASEDEDNNELDELEIPGLIIRSENADDDDDDESDLMEGFNDTIQLDDSVKNLFNFLKKIVF